MLAMVPLPGKTMLTASARARALVVKVPSGSLIAAIARRAETTATPALITGIAPTSTEPMTLPTSLPASCVVNFVSSAVSPASAAREPTLLSVSLTSTLSSTRGGVVSWGIASPLCVVRPRPAKRTLSGRPPSSACADNPGPCTSKRVFLPIVRRSTTFSRSTLPCSPSLTQANFTSWRPSFSG